MNLLCFALLASYIEFSAGFRVRRRKKGTSAGQDITLFLSIYNRNGFDPKKGLVPRDVTDREYNAFLKNKNLGSWTPFGVPAYGHWHMLTYPVKPQEVDMPLWQYTFHLKSVTVWCGPDSRGTDECVRWWSKSGDCLNDFNGLTRAAAYSVYYIPPCASGSYNQYISTDNVVIVPSSVQLGLALTDPKAESLPTPTFAFCPDPAHVYPDCVEDFQLVRVAPHKIYGQDVAGRHLQDKEAQNDQWQKHHWNVFLVTMYAKVIDAILQRSGLTSQPHIPVPYKLSWEKLFMERAKGREGTNPLDGKLMVNASWQDPKDKYYRSSDLYIALGAKVDEDVEVSAEEMGLTSYHNVMISQNPKYNWMRIDFEPNSFKIDPIALLCVANEDVKALVERGDKRAGRAAAAETFQNLKIHQTEIMFAEELVHARAKTGDERYKAVSMLLAGAGGERHEIDIQESLRTLSIGLRDTYVGHRVRPEKQKKRKSSGAVTSSDDARSQPGSPRRVSG